ncbi:hypothetical protein C6Y62_11555 [Hyphomicrobium sulfonivorans]|nr:hypothetical protein [Hyphomicrobium sulfonivorans]
MHLHKANKYKQHFLMQELESSGNVAVYCTSAVADKRALDALYLKGRVFDAATVFAPCEINLPSLDDDHHVSFCHGSKNAWVYSKEGTPFARKTITFGDILERLRERKDVPIKSQIDQIRELVEDFDRIGAEKMAERQRLKREYPFSHTPTGSDTPPQIRTVEESKAEQHERRARTRNIESVVKRAAIEAFFEADTLLLSISRRALA